MRQSLAATPQITKAIPPAPRSRPRRADKSPLENIERLPPAEREEMAECAARMRRDIRRLEWLLRACGVKPIYRELYRLRDGAQFLHAVLEPCKPVWGTTSSEAEGR